ncbi:MAG TPA: hypothetical protein V6C78_12290 [Crinalium sp.]
MRPIDTNVSNQSRRYKAFSEDGEWVGGYRQRLQRSPLQALPTSTSSS